MSNESSATPCRSSEADSNSVWDLVKEAAFLLDRLDSYERDLSDEEENYRDWYGHVAPSIARLRLLVEAVSRDLHPRCALTD